MTYRALTHGRVYMSGSTTRFQTPAGTQTQAAAVNSSKGVANNGPVTAQKNKNNQSNNQPRRFYARTLLSNLLLAPNAFGPASEYSYGEGKGFPNALPQTSVGSTNSFARRAVARRAVTGLGAANDGPCCTTISAPKNLN